MSVFESPDEAAGRAAAQPSRSPSQTIRLPRSQPSAKLETLDGLPQQTTKCPGLDAFAGDDMNLRREVSRKLVSLGFVRTDRMHLLRLDQEFSFWVDTGPLGSRPDIAPFAGLRSDSIETLFAEFLGVPALETVGTVGGNVGYVLTGQREKYRWWDPPADPAEVVSVIQAALERYRPFARLSLMREAWNVIPFPVDPGDKYRLVVLAVVNRDRAAVPALLKEAEEQYCAREDEVCEQFRDFQQRVLTHVQLTS